MNLVKICCTTMILLSSLVGFANTETILLYSPEDNVTFQRVDIEGDDSEFYLFEKCRLVVTESETTKDDCVVLTRYIERGTEEIVNMEFDRILDQNLRDELKEIEKNLMNPAHTIGAVAAAAGIIIHALKPTTAPANAAGVRAGNWLLGGGILLFFIAEAVQEINADGSIGGELPSFQETIDVSLEEEGIEISEDTKKEIRKAALRAFEKSLRDIRNINGASII